MMNRVFAENTAIDLDPVADNGDVAPHRPLLPLTGPPPRATQAPALAPRGLRSASNLFALLLAMLGGLGLVGGLGAVLLVQQWTGLQRSLSQERNLLLVERLRAMGPATAPSDPATIATPPAPVLTPQPSVEARGVAAFDGLPPPPPEEPWMEQLADLPTSQGRPAPLRVPVSPRIAAAAPAASGSRNPAPAGGAAGKGSRERTAGPLPQLVGLVGAPGRAGSAIFQVGETSMNVNVGEAIGGSGWRLRAADAESALIERGTDVRRIAIVTGG